jgi:AraC-like DNA-binding protein
MNRSPKEWFMEQRFRHARRILLETGSVKTAALELGYTQTANFSRDFKKHHGMSATDLLQEA